MKRRYDRCPHFLASVAVIAILPTLVTGNAQAQTAASPIDTSQADSATAPQGQKPANTQKAGAEIIVTGSRIDRAGYLSPTPTVRISAAELSVGARANVGAALADLPQFKASQSPQTSSTNVQAGREPVDLRNLGEVRTLTLLDGRRFVGDNDLNSVPSILIKSVDIVTGGASAAWGSGAVAGVVNLTIDDKFSGIKLGASSGISTYGDDGQHRFEGEVGTKFADGRGHILIGGEYFRDEGIAPRTDRANAGRWSSIPNGNGTFTLTPNVGYANAYPGGIILSGALKNQVFNTDGTLRPAVLGRVVGTNSIGGDAPSDDDISPLIPPQRHYAVLGRISYQLADNLKITGDYRRSRYWGNYTWFGDHSRNVTIQSDNAFLQPEIKADLAAAGETSFTLGRFNSDLSFPRIDEKRITNQGTLSLDGSFANGRWRYGAFYSHGDYKLDLDTPGFRLTQNFANAVDSVISPTTGQPVCRIALTSPSTNCVPINLFGVGSPSQAAINYVTGAPKRNATTTLDNAGASLRGEPFDLPAGPVSVAIGGEWRRDAVVQTVDALSLVKAFASFQGSPYRGSDIVKEGFAEIAVPIVKNVTLLRDLELNGAARISDYRTSGSIWSWKVGATDEFLPGVTGRITRSRDIRSANLAELYTQSTLSNVVVNDTKNNTSPLVQVFGGGNPALTPEKADTLTAGLVLSPLPRLNMSIDYYNINIKNVITAIAPQDLVNRCNDGSVTACSRVIRGSDGVITSVIQTNINLARYKTNGIDGELSYRLPISAISPGAPGALDFHILGTWVNSLTQDDGVNKVEYVKSQGYAFVSGVPRWRLNGSVEYSNKVLDALVRARYISPGLYDGTVNYTNNHIPAYTYIDLQISGHVMQDRMPGLEVYMDVTNLFNKQPPIGSDFTAYYDVIGRYITVGARIQL